MELKERTAPDSGLKSIQRSPNSAEIYRRQAPLLYGILRRFLGVQASAEAMTKLAKRITALSNDSGYSRYEAALCLRILFEHLQDPSIGFQLPEKFSDLSFEEYFGLLLRDRYSITCAGIAAACGTSEGAIRTRLILARAKAFASASKSRAPQTASSNSLRTCGAAANGHSCLFAAPLVEDAIPEDVASAVLVRKTVDCARCASLLHLRAQSLAFFRNSPEPRIPEALSTIQSSALLLREDGSWKLNLSSMAWYYKVLIEGLLASVIVLGIVFSMPRVKRVYEFWVERRLDLYNLAEFNPESAELPESSPQDEAASGQTADVPAPQNPAPQKSAVTAETEFVGRDSDRPSSEKVYRILIKTDSPQNIRVAVMAALGDFKTQSATRDGLTSELPGGIIFDVFVPFDSYKPLLNRLIQLGEAKIIITHSKERGLPGKARLKIWLQRI